MHTYVRTYIRTYVHTYIRTYVHAHIYIYVHMYLSIWGGVAVIVTSGCCNTQIIVTMLTPNQVPNVTKVFAIRVCRTFALCYGFENEKTNNISRTNHHDNNHKNDHHYTHHNNNNNNNSHNDHNNQDSRCSFICSKNGRLELTLSHQQWILART